MNFVKLDDVCDAYTKNIALKDLPSNAGDYPIFGASGYIKNVDFAISNKPYIGIVKDGAGVGRTNIYPTNSSLLGTMQYIFPNDSTDIHYLMYAIRHLNLGNSLSGATIPHIYWKNYKSSKIAYYDISVQKRIGEILSNIEKSISILKQKISMLDDLIKSRLFNYLGS